MENTTFEAKLRSDKRKSPEMKQYRRLTFQECKNLSGHSLYLDRFGQIATVKITTIKTWKTRPEIEIHCKFGMYEYFQDTIRPDDLDRINFVVEVTGNN
jgi:hypothetical protein